MNPAVTISRYFVSNRKLSTLLCAALCFWGLLSFVLTPKRYNPDIVAPAFEIRVEAPGMTARETRELVTKPLENVVQEISGVEDIYSKSVYGGMAVVTVRFYVGEDLERSMILLRQRISSNLDLKPVGVGEPSIRAIDPDDLPVITLALLPGKLQPEEVRRRALQLKDELKMIPGTSIVDVVGGKKSEYQIMLDPARLQASKTDVQEIDQTLAKTSILSRLGVLKKDSAYEPVELSSTVDSPAEIQDLFIAANMTATLRARDVGEVVEGTAEMDSKTLLETRQGVIEDAVFISLAKKKGVNVVPWAQRVREEVNALSERASFLKGIEVRVLRDEGRVASEEITGLSQSLIQAVAIVFAVLFLFLNARAAAIVAVSIPLTLMAVFGIGLLGGYTINRITLFALILSLGLLVDAATVVVENIVRHRKMNPDMPETEMIPLAVGEVGAGLFLSTLTTVLAFLPMAFVTGMMGPYMGPIPFFLPVALIVSLILSFTLNPWLASLLCKRGGAPGEGPRIPVLETLKKRGVLGYEGLMKSLLNREGLRRMVLGICTLCVVLVMLFPAIGLVRFRMLPKADRNQIYIYLDLNRGSSLERTLAASRAVSSRLMTDKRVENVQSFVGMPPILDFNGMFRGTSGRSETHQATLRVNLLHHSKRKDPSEVIAVSLRRLVASALEGWSDARFQMIEDPPGPPVQATFLAKVKGSHPALVRKTAMDLEGKMRSLSGVADLDTTLDEPLQKYVIEVDRQKAAVAKVSTASIARVLRIFYEGGRIGVYHREANREQEYIVLKFSRRIRRRIEDLNKLHLTNELGNPVPVMKFLRVSEAPAEDTILGDNRMESVYLSGEMENRSVTYAAIDALKLLAGYEAPEGGKRSQLGLFGARYETEDGRAVEVALGGEWELTLEVFRDLGTAMGVAVFLIYCVMVIQFRSYRIPLLILGTIPLAMIGVMPGFALLFAMSRVYFSATSMIGVIALAGIVVNNAIILVEYIQQLVRAHAGTPQEILLEACRTRMRPILLTSVTTILGTLMIAADPVWSGLAWSVVFGLSLSSVLTLVFFPLLLMEFAPALLKRPENHAKR